MLTGAKNNGKQVERSELIAVIHLGHRRLVMIVLPVRVTSFVIETIAVDGAGRCNGPEDSSLVSVQK